MRGGIERGGKASTEIYSVMPLTVPCVECQGHGRLWHGERGPGDPIGCYVSCDATDCENGEVAIPCEVWTCRAPAVEWVDGVPLCPTRAAEEKTNGFGEVG